MRIGTIGGNSFEAKAIRAVAVIILSWFALGWVWAQTGLSAESFSPKNIATWALIILILASLAFIVKGVLSSIGSNTAKWSLKTWKTELAVIGIGLVFYAALSAGVFKGLGFASIVGTP